MPSEIHVCSRIDPETKCLHVRCGGAGDDKAQLLAELRALHAAYCRLGDTYERQAVWAEEYTDFATDVKGVKGGFRLAVSKTEVEPNFIPAHSSETEVALLAP